MNPSRRHRDQRAVLLSCRRREGFGAIQDSQCMAVNAWCSFAGAVTLSAAVLALATAPAPAQTPKDLNCTGNPDIAWDLQVVGCSKAIESGRSSGKNLAAILVNRGNAYHNTGKDDAALADYNEALSSIRQRPPPITAGSIRGRATSIAPSPITTRRAGSTPMMRSRSTIAAAPIRPNPIPTGRSPTTARPSGCIPMPARPSPNRCRAYADKQDVEPALADCEQGAGLDPHEPRVFFWRGGH